MMIPIILAASSSTNIKLALGIGLVIFIVLFFKLLVGFLKFCLRHPFISLLFLIGGGLGLAFHFLLGVIVIIAVVCGGLVFFALDQFN
ncbi:hypothetical protein FC84_GL000928 [Lapidilactobacillus dextrinicus DSM 20335]|uniref:Uncharacterized protein n=2 Tax=Lapidilactobacillus dextrinicus TaxID=51664 RepID=A0A0R2BGW1_9LACO|nr:hypothetical protein FC84_GL000928 [Lapidilactobacillus dextrinicus DSM 20335]